MTTTTRSPLTRTARIVLRLIDDAIHAKLPEPASLNVMDGQALLIFVEFDEVRAWAEWMGAPVSETFHTSSFGPTHHISTTRVLGDGGIRVKVTSNRVVES